MMARAPIEKETTRSKPLSTLPSVATAAANAILTGKPLPKEATTAGYAEAQAAEADALTKKPNKKSIGIYTDPATGDVIERYDDTSEVTVRKGTIALNNKATADANKAAAEAGRQSAYDLLFEQFSKYGLGSLVEPLKGFITSGISPSEFTIKLRETPAYQQRFSANAERIKKGLKPLVEGDYLALEDQYQNVMRNYGLPETYWKRGDLGTQEGFTKLLANDVSAVELENRIMTAQDRVLKANPEVLNALKSFYGSSINNGDILAYTLDPVNALKDIQRKVTAAEIGGAAAQAGLTTGMARAEELAAAGVNKAEAQQGFQTVAQVAPRGTQLAEIYKQQPYGQTQAEQEVFNLAGSVEAQKQRKKLAGLEQAAFGAKSGAAQGALQRERAGNL